MDLKQSPLLKKALVFAEDSLAGQKRKSGEDILDHCIRVANILDQFKVHEPSTLAAAILHHSLSEGAATREDIKKQFGADIASIIDAFENLRILRIKPGMQDEFAENLRKMFLVLAKDLRVVLIKLADILDNLTTVECLSLEKREQICRETLEIFAPLAERLGMSELKGRLQDLAFKNLYPQEYNLVKKSSTLVLSKLDHELLKIKSKLIQALEEDEIEVQIQSRVKHVYSLYTKLQRPEVGNDFSKVYDLMALRVITKSEEDCYRSLDRINKMFRILDGKITDFINHPKSNGYQSIHIKAMGPSNIPFEIQIRTEKMHQQAEYGLAAHWNYAEKKESGLSDEKIRQGFAASAEKLDWVKKLSEWQKEVTDNQEFLKDIKTDFFGERIFVFTPKGDVKDLPAGSTPVDFAYKVHTDLGSKILGAKVNGKMASLDLKLHDGDTVEILTTKDKFKKPNRDWLNFVVTSAAKKRIKKAYF